MPGSARSRSIIPKVSKALPVAAGGLLVAALVSVATPALAADTASINGATTYQTMAGFGVSEGFGQASTVMDASSSVQQQVLKYLYSTSGSAGLTILRNEISADSGDTIEPNAPSSPTATPTYVPLSSIGDDQGQLWFAQQIGASGAATFAWTVSSSSSGGGGSCEVIYTTTDQWTGGFTASVAITNTGSSAISSWTLKFTFPGNQAITDTWNGVESQSGENVTISNESYNGAIAAGGSISLGFQGTWSTSDAAPTAFTVNGNSCTT